MPPKKPTDLDKLQGTWRVTALAMDGDERLDGAFAAATITIHGAEFTSRGMGDAYAGTIELVPGKDPKAFDLVFTGGPPQGMRNQGIYKLAGDTWTICLATRGDARPKRFASRPDSGLALETLERQADPRRRTTRTTGVSPKTSKEAIATRARAGSTAQTDDLSTGAPTEIEGEWPMVSGVFDGRPLADEMVKWCKRVTLGSVTRILAGPQTMLDADFTLDAAHTPRHIDYVNRSGKSKDKKQVGIYEIAGDTLRICMAAPGDARPANFASAKGDGRTFTVWKRS